MNESRCKICFFLMLLFFVVGLFIFLIYSSFGSFITFVVFSLLSIFVAIISDDCDVRYRDDYF